ncbi:MAG: nucleotidyltransferase domain-containing protein [Nitrososphaerota archaeon]|nr:nucleotidyltransferase domain-containing protein [Candidatus Bathyarchaeota archaeon]MDW8194282.1 nucleotidyltransferase domain-containing protein [Nitrososphaerota archaeon]
MGSSQTVDLRRIVAREAAALLYMGIEKEYKQAKLKAAKNLGVHFLPTNIEVAIELDRMAEENEGSTRLERLIRMRHEALMIMRILKKYNPVLFGSVWRGTITRNSDIDITVYSENPIEVLELLKQHFKILTAKPMSVTKHGRIRSSFQILLELPSGENAEITVRSIDEVCLREYCEIFGDENVGLRLQDLEKLLSKNPTRRFVPF